MHNKVALFLNGEKPKIIPELKHYDWVVCTDGAYHFLVESHITPDLIIGDFDSIGSLPVDIPHVHTPNQDYTDFEKALVHIFKKGFSNIDVFAANGLEQDHFLGNLTTALKFKTKLKITFFDDNHSYFFINKKIVLNEVLGKTISLFPFPKATKVYTKGLKYVLKGKTLSMKKNKISTRNKAIDPDVEIQFKKGEILMFVEI